MLGADVQSERLRLAINIDINLPTLINFKQIGLIRHPDTHCFASIVRVHYLPWISTQKKEQK